MAYPDLMSLVHIGLQPINVTGLALNELEPSDWRRLRRRIRTRIALDRHLQVGMVDIFDHTVNFSILRYIHLYVGVFLSIQRAFSYLVSPNCSNECIIKV